MMGRYPLLGPVRRPGSHDRLHVDEALAKVGMSRHRDRQIGRLSGGQRRRVFLARALAADPALYLLDEPVTGIDATTQEDLMDILEGETRRGRTVVATTHDLACAAQRFQRVAMINRRMSPTGRLRWSSIAAAGPDLRRPPAIPRRRDGAARRRPPPRSAGRRGRAALPRRRDAVTDWLLEPLAFAFFQRALVAAVLAGVVCALVGSYVVLKGLAFIGDAIAHAAFPGVVAAFIVGGPYVLGGGIAAFLSAIAIGWISRRGGCASTPPSASCSPAPLHWAC
jgi:energy-coupling factor transporter ATP-binding protein EcfA2